MEIAKIEIVTDGGPWAEHNMPCPICWEKSAVLNMSTNRFDACWDCQKEGWHVCRTKPKGILKGLLVVEAA
jgi:hypothetical protein